MSDRTVDTLRVAPSDVKPHFTFVIRAQIKVTATSVDEAKEIFSKATGAQILENCDRYSVEGKGRAK